MADNMLKLKSDPNLVVFDICYKSMLNLWVMAAIFVNSGKWLPSKMADSMLMLKIHQNLVVFGFCYNSLC